MEHTESALHRFWSYRRALVPAVLAVAVTGCGTLGSSPAPTATPSPQPTSTPRTNVIVTTSTPTPTPSRATVLVVVTATRTATPKPKPTRTATHQTKKRRKTTHKKTHKVHKPVRKPAPRPKPTATHAAKPKPSPTKVHHVVHHRAPTATPRPRPSPTHRPRRRVTPKPHPTKTPTPKPRPTRTRAPSRTHIRLGLIGVPPGTARAIQRLADAGNPNATYYRNPIALLYHNLPGYGFKGTFTINQPITITVRYNHKGYDVHLRQLAKMGKGGAWFITSITAHPGALPPAPTPRPGSPPTPVPAATPHLGQVTHSTSNVQATQKQVTAGNAAYTYYLNPVAVVERNLSAYGFTLPVPIVQPLIITVTYQGKMYDILLKQPVKQGVTGIWLTQEIRLHK